MEESFGLVSSDSTHSLQRTENYIALSASALKHFSANLTYGYGAAIFFRRLKFTHLPIDPLLSSPELRRHVAVLNCNSIAIG